MSKMIEATPALKGKEAERFIRNMIKKGKGKPTKKEMEIFRKIMLMPGGKTPRCRYCGKAMKNTKDQTTGKPSKYLWKCGCKGFPKDMIMSIG